jgi:hypothetical protein
MVMAAKCGKHPKPLLEYLHMNQLKPLAESNPWGKVVLGLLVPLVDAYQDAMVVAVEMEDPELCCTTGWAFHFHPK